MSQHYCHFGKSTTFKQVEEFPVNQELQKAIVEQRLGNSKILYSSQKASMARAWELRDLLTGATSTDHKYSQNSVTTAAVTHPEIKNHLDIFRLFINYIHRTEVPDFRTANNGQVTNSSKFMLRPLMLRAYNVHINLEHCREMSYFIKNLVHALKSLSANKNTLHPYPLTAHSQTKLSTFWHPSSSKHVFFQDLWIQPTLFPDLNH